MTLPILINLADKQERRKKALELSSQSSKWDFLELDAQENPGIEGLREFTSRLAKKPFNSDFQTAVIWEANNLTIEAQNALLKILEEPSATLKIILTAPIASGLLSTIVSRCLILDLSGYGGGGNSKKIDAFLNKEFYERWQNCEKLDLDNWSFFWHEKLREKIQTGGTTNEILKIARYTRLILKAKSLRKNRVNPRLANTLLLLQPPLSVL